MATWKKIITSGSNADLNQITASGGISGTLDTAAQTNITSVGTLSSVTVSGNITANGNILGDGSTELQDINKLEVTEIFGRDNDTDTKIVFAEDDITFTVGNEQFLKFTEDGSQDIITFGDAGDIDFKVRSSGTDNAIFVSGDVGSSSFGTTAITPDAIVTAEGTISASGFTTHGVISGSTISGSFVGDGSNLTGVSQDIDTLSAGSDIVAGDKFIYSNDGTEESVTFGIITSSVFENIAGDVTITAGGDSAIGNDKVTFAKVQNVATNRILGRTSGGSGDVEELTPAAVFATFNSDLGGNFTIGNQSDDTATFTGGVTIGGDLTVNGTTTTVATDQLTVSESLIFLATGSATLNVDAGILVQSSSMPDTGSALYHDISEQRWSVAKTVSIADFSIDPLQFVTTVKTDNVNPDSTSGSYGAGEMHVNTASGDIWIRYE